MQQHAAQRRSSATSWSSKQIVTPEQLLEAIERQHKMPLVRIGEALISLGMIDDGQLKEALVQQQLDRSVPLGEVLVRMGVVSREDLQTRAGPQDGLSAGRRRGVPGRGRGAAQAPLRGRVAAARDAAAASATAAWWSALEDPSRRAAIDEIEFNAEHEGRAGARAQPLDRAVLHAAYDKIGSRRPRRQGRRTDVAVPTSR